MFPLFLDAMTRCAPKDLGAPGTPEIEGEGCDGHDNFHHDTIIVLLPIVSSLFVENICPVLDDFTLEKVTPSHHCLVIDLQRAACWPNTSKHYSILISKLTRHYYCKWSTNAIVSLMVLCLEVLEIFKITTLTIHHWEICFWKSIPCTIHTQMCMF